MGSESKKKRLRMGRIGLRPVISDKIGAVALRKSQWARTEMAWDLTRLPAAMLASLEPALEPCQGSGPLRGCDCVADWLDDDA